MRTTIQILMVVSIIVTTLAGGTALAADAAFQVLTGERQLFLDDVDIAKIDNLERTMHKPAKKGAVIRPDTSIGLNAVQIRMAPIWHPEKKVWQLWDCASEPDDLHAAGYFFSGYYESPDGLHWSKIPVGEIEYRGSRDNNFVSVVMGGKRHRCECIVRDETDPDPNRRYKTFTPNVFRVDKGGYAVSPDGIHWTEVSSPGIYAGDEWNLTFDEKEHLFLQYLKRGGKHGRSIWLTTSKDFENWTEPERIFEADDLDQELGIERIKARIADPKMKKQVYNDPDDYNIDVYNMSPFRYESVYLGTPAMYHAVGKNTINNTDGFHLIELVSSRDLKNWIRQGDREAFIPLSPIGAGAYDTVQMIGPASAVVRGNELWFYYTGFKSRGPEYDEQGGAICLAVLRRDGFVSLNAVETEGGVQTKPFAVPGGQLHVNVDAPDGELRVEVLDGDGKVVSRSVPTSGDQPNAEVQWETGDIGALQGKIASLRFTLSKGSLYSYWFQ
jgi:hypothetical protein